MHIKHFITRPLRSLIYLVAFVIAAVLSQWVVDALMGEGDNSWLFALLGFFGGEDGGE